MKLSFFIKKYNIHEQQRIFFYFLKWWFHEFFWFNFTPRNPLKQVNKNPDPPSKKNYKIKIKRIEKKPTIKTNKWIKKTSQTKTRTHCQLVRVVYILILWIPTNTLSLDIQTFVPVKIYSEVLFKAKKVWLDDCVQYSFVCDTFHHSFLISIKILIPFGM